MRDLDVCPVASAVDAPRAVAPDLREVADGIHRVAEEHAFLRRRLNDLCTSLTRAQLRLLLEIVRRDVFGSHNLLERIARSEGIEVAPEPGADPSARVGDR